MEPLGSTLEKIVAGSIRRAPAAQAAPFAWPLACGSVVAERTRALEFCNGVLRVEVPDAAWRAQLQELAPRYLIALNRYIRGVSRIEFVLRKSAPGTEKSALAG